MSEYQIEKNVPIPESMKRGKYDILKLMQVGDSFFFPDPKGSQGSLGRALRSSAYNYKIKVTMRREGEGARVWRIE